MNILYNEDRKMLEYVLVFSLTCFTMGKNESF